MFQPEKYAEEHNIGIVSFRLNDAKCFATSIHGREYVVHDPHAWRTEAERLEMLTHEIAHLKTGALYSQALPYETVGRIEYRAEKETIRLLISEKDLDEAVASGYTEVWELAEYFGLPEQTIKKAVSLYTHGNINAELYFI